MASECRPTLSIATGPASHVIARASRRSAITPATVVAMVAVGLSSSVIVPLGVACLIVLFAGLGIFTVRSSAAPMRRALARSAIRRARRARRDARERMIGGANFAHETLGELTRLVDDIERIDPDLAERIDLENLLDRHATLISAHERASRAVSMADRIQLERQRDSYRADRASNPRRLELCERRLHCLRQCEARVEGLADEIAIVADFIRLVAQHTACPDDPFNDDAIDRQLAELEAEDAARHQVAAEFH